MDKPTARTLFFENARAVISGYVVSFPLRDFDFEVEVIGAGERKCEVETSFSTS